MSNYVLTYVWCPYCKEFHGCVYYSQGDSYHPEGPYFVCPVTGNLFTEKDQKFN